jgi:phage FluMu protein Com
VTIDFQCPHCDKSLKTSADKAGRQAKCPGCGEVIDIPETGEHDSDSTPQAHVVEQAHLAEDESLRKPTQLPTTPGDTRPCPMCGEQIKAAAIRCRFCGEVFQSREATRGRPSGFREMRPFPAGEVISEAWRIFTDRMGLVVGSFLASSFLTYITNLAVQVPLTFSEMLLNQGQNAEAFVLAGVGIISAIMALVFAFYLQAGYLVTQVKVAREQPAEFGDLFSGGRFTLRLVLASILFGLMGIIGLMACIIPGLILCLMFWPFSYVLVAENRPAIDCLSRAKELTDGNWGSMFIILIFAVACWIAGALACGVGLIFAVPFTQILFAVAYDRMTCQTPLSELNSRTNS